MSEGTPFGFSFAYPWVLLFLLLLPILAVLKGRFGGTAGVTFSSTSALAALGRRRRSRAGALLALLAHLALASLVVALARPHLMDLYFTVRAAGWYGASDIHCPPQYLSGRDQLFRNSVRERADMTELRLKAKPKPQIDSWKQAAE